MISVLYHDLIRRYMIIKPYWLLVTHLLTLLFSVVFVKYAKRHNYSMKKCVVCITLFAYIVTIYMSTVIARYHRWNTSISLNPFSSWLKVLNGNAGTAKELIENVLLLMPVGVMLPLIDIKKYNLVKTVLIGFLLSLTIEVSQYVHETGFFEVDDLINNTLGAMLGCFLSCIGALLKNIIETKKK